MQCPPLARATLLASALAAPATAQVDGVVDLDPTPPPDTSYPLLVDGTASVAGPGTDFADDGGGRGQALVDIVGPDPADPTNPDKVGPPDGVLDLVQVNSNSPALPLGAGPGEWITPPVGTLNASVVVYRGASDGTFTDVTEWMSPESPDGFNVAYPCGSPWGVVTADYDDDGDLDLFFPCGGFNMDSSNALLQNDGDGTFTNVSSAEGFTDFNVTFSATWFDYDRDGDLDLFEANSTAVLPSFYLGSPGPDPADRLFEYDDVTGFTNVAATAGVDLKGTGFSCAVSDLDLDGWPDLVLSCYRQFNKVYYNQGDGTFHFMLRDGSITLGDLNPDPAYPGTFDLNHLLTPELAAVLPILGVLSMPVEVQDFNADGWPDLCFSAFSNQLEDANTQSALGAQFLPSDPTSLYLNKGDQDHDGIGDGFFREVAEEVGIAHVGGCMGHISGDFNGDGFPDMYMGGGGPQVDTHLEEDYLYINNGASWPIDFQADPDQPLGKVFYEVGALAGTYSNIFMAHGLTSFRSGGTVDVIVGNGGPGLLDLGQPNVYYENTGNFGGTPGRFLDVSIEPTLSPPGAIGARVEIVRDRIAEAGRTTAQEKRTGIAFASHNGGPLAFGRGDDGVLYVDVQWPSGIRQGELLWPDRQDIDTLEMTEPTLSVGFDVRYPAGGGVELALEVVETGQAPVDAAVYFLALTQQIPGFFLPSLVELVVPFTTLQPNVPVQLSGSAAGLERGLYGVIVVGGAPLGILGAGAGWHEPTAQPASAPTDDSAAPFAVVPSTEPPERPEPFRHANVTPAVSIRLRAETLRVARDRLPLEWTVHELTGEGAVGLPGGALFTWQDGRLDVQLTELGATSLSFNAEVPTLTVGRPMACCDTRATQHGYVVRFEGVDGPLDVDGVGYAADGQRVGLVED